MNTNENSFDEYHFGAWKESAKKLFESDDEEAEEEDRASLERIDESWLPITAARYLYLSEKEYKEFYLAQQKSLCESGSTKRGCAAVRR